MGITVLTNWPFDTNSGRKRQQAASRGTACTSHTARRTQHNAQAVNWYKSGNMRCEATTVAIEPEDKPNWGIQHAQGRRWGSHSTTLFDCPIVSLSSSQRSPFTAVLPVGVEGTGSGSAARWLTHQVVVEAGIQLMHLPAWPLARTGHTPWWTQAVVTWQHIAPGPSHPTPRGADPHLLAVLFLCVARPPTYLQVTAQRPPAPGAVPSGGGHGPGTGGGQQAAAVCGDGGGGGRALGHDEAL